MSSRLSIESIVQIADGIVSATVAGEVVILDPDSAKYYGVEGAGVEIWEMMSEPQRVSELCDKLLEIYDVDRDRCERDLMGILEGMQDDGLIEVLEE